MAGFMRRGGDQHDAPVAVLGRLRAVADQGKTMQLRYAPRGAYLGLGAFGMVVRRAGLCAVTRHYPRFAARLPCRLPSSPPPSC